MDRRSRIYWYDQYALNEQDTAFAKYDPDRIAKELMDTGVEIIAVYAANQFGIAYYPSQIWPQHPGLKGRDYVGELISRLRPQGRKILLYINWLDSKHAEWNMLPIDRQNDPYYAEQSLAAWAQPSRPNGRIQALAGGAWRLPCLNSPHREEILAVTQEITERYRPDAFHLDMFLNPEICVCHFCRPTLEKICGTKEITKKAVEEHWVDFINWRCENSASLVAEATAILKKYGIAAAHNAFSPLYQSALNGLDEEWLKSLDVYVSECFDALLVPVSDLNSTSINVRWQHTAGKPSWILLNSTPLHYGHQPISEAEWQIYASACKANGCKVFGPCGVGAHPDTTTAKRLLANVKKGLDFYMEDADLDPGAVSAARIVLVFSWATRKYFEPGVNPLQWTEELHGWARLLVEEHLPFDIITAERITAVEKLADYDLVILPNAANVSKDFCDVVREYIRDGGRVIATAETSLRDEKGNILSDFQLSDVLGISRQGSFEAPFAIEGHSEPEPAFGIFQKVSASGKTIARLVSVDPAGSVAGMKDPLPMETTDWPVFTRNGHGKGQTCYISFDIGRFYAKHGDQHIGKRMAELVDSILPSRQIEIRAPRTVEVTVWRQEKPNRTIIHLANRTVAWTLPTDNRQITEIIPVYDIELVMKKPCDNPVVTSRHAQITFRTKDNNLVVNINQLLAYAAIVISQPS